VTVAPSKGPDKKKIERVAGALGIREGYVEKDWHVAQVLKALQTVDYNGFHLVFGGGTSLSKAYGLIKRFSEDIDLRVSSATKLPPLTGQHPKKFRHAVEGALEEAGYPVDKTLSFRHADKMFGLCVPYERLFPIPDLRPEIKIEISFEDLKLAAQERDIQSFIALSDKANPEVTSLRCVDPIETAADKLAALSWRVFEHKDLPSTRPEGDTTTKLRDRSLVRHVHDLCALENKVKGDANFFRLCRESVAGDENRGGASREGRPKEAAPLLQGMCTLLAAPPFPQDYANFVQNAAYGGKPPDYMTALGAVERLVLAIVRAADGTMAVTQKVGV
jgi:predicted nucleotidyltransferase component of viral defense system